MKRIFFPIIFIFLALPGFVNGADQFPIIKDVRGEIFDDNAQIIVESNCDIEYLDYTLQNPNRIVIDPMGKVYSDLKETIIFERGPVKKVDIVRGKAEEGSSGNFYPLDFIVIELRTSEEYKVTKDIKQEIIVVDIGKKKEVEVSKLIPEAAQEEAEAEKEIEQPVPLEEEVPPPAQAVSVSPPPQAAIEELPKPKEEPPQETPEVIPLEEPKTQGAQPSAPEPVKLIYRIGEGDTLDISVWQHPELDKKVIVRPDGYVSFPLVGDINAKGLAPQELASNVRENLSRLIKDPQVTVIVSGFGSKYVFVFGEVTKPGSYPYRGGTSVLDAISDAGGWKNSAVLNSVMLVRKAFTEAPEAHRLDVYAIFKKGDFSQNLPVMPGDIVYVPKSFIANIGGFIDNLKISVGAYITNTTNIFD